MEDRENDKPVAAPVRSMPAVVFAIAKTKEFENIIR